LSKFSAWRANARPTVKGSFQRGGAGGALGGWLTRLRLSQPALAFEVGTTDEMDVLMVGGALDLAIGTRGLRLSRDRAPAIGSEAAPQRGVRRHRT